MAETFLVIQQAEEWQLHLKGTKTLLALLEDSVLTQLSSYQNGCRENVYGDNLKPSFSHCGVLCFAAATGKEKHRSGETH